MQFSSGNVYNGEWKDDRQNGTGTMRWVVKEGRPIPEEIYKGEWKNGLPDGEGEYRWQVVSAVAVDEKQQQQQFNTHRGSFQAGLRHGPGLALYADGSSYKGIWVHDKKQGAGRFTRGWGLPCDVRVSDDRVPFEQIRIMEKKLISSSSSSSSASMGASGGGTRVAVPIKIGDICSNPKQEDKVKQLVFRNLPLLKVIFRHYSAIGTSHVDKKTSMSLHQFWRFCKDGQIPCAKLPLASIDRIFIAANTPGDGSSGSLPQKRDIHNPENAFLFAEFVEGLVRIAYEKYSGEADDLYDRVQMLILASILPVGDALTSGDSLLLLMSSGQSAASLRDPVVAVLRPVTSWLRRVYQFYARMDMSTLQAAAHDTTVNVREFLRCLRDVRGIDSDLSANDAMRIFVESNQVSAFGASSRVGKTADGPGGAAGETDDFADGTILQYEMTFEEFVEGMVRIALFRTRAMEQTLTEGERVQLFLDKHLLPHARTC